MRINKTKGNLQKVWDDLDLASGALYNALNNLSNMVNISDEIINIINTIDVTAIDVLKNEIGELMEEE